MAIVKMAHTKEILLIYCETEMTNNKIVHYYLVWAAHMSVAYFFGQPCHTMRFGSQTQATQAVVGTGALLAPTIVDVTNSSFALSHAFLSW